MGIFGSYKRSSTAETTATNIEPLISESGAPRKKNAPTPSRKQAEKERMERLHPTLTAKELRKVEAAERRISTDQRFGKVEASPIRALCRNYIDAKWHIGEFLMPVMLILLALAMGFAKQPRLFMVVSSVVWVLLAAAILDMIVTWRGFKRLAAERLPGVSTKGLSWYTVNRVIQIRRFRVPGPAIKRGDKF